MKKIKIIPVLFVAAQLSMHAQYYINGTTDATLGNKVLLHSNELKIGNSTSASERTKNLLKFGDGSYVQIGEWEADDLLSFKATKFNFSNGNVGIGTTSPTEKLEINGKLKISSTIQTRGSICFEGTYGKFNLENNLWTGQSILLYPSKSDGSWDFDKQLEFHGDGSFRTNGDVHIGGNADDDVSKTTQFIGLGHKLKIGGVGSYSDEIWMAKYVPSDNYVDLRINIGDDNSGDDRFVVGTTFCEDGLFHTHLIVANDGNMYLNGTAHVHEVKIETAEWADFVFHDDYRLKPLSEVNTFIKENKHLPEIPSAAEVEKNEGVNVGEMQVKLLQKIEELTLYIIQQQETVDALKIRVNELENKK
ncbi:MAG: hypothetical protein LBJ17_03615 [Dysgonamonadaceae bacterium]|jgi:hypothetical protein|nr:hypothetical protein [Dysgonamonadaceae bacterium]